MAAKVERARKFTGDIQEAVGQAAADFLEQEVAPGKIPRCPAPPLAYRAAIENMHAVRHSAQYGAYCAPAIPINPDMV